MQNYLLSMQSCLLWLTTEAWHSSPAFHKRATAWNSFHLSDLSFECVNEEDEKYLFLGLLKKNTGISK